MALSNWGHQPAIQPVFVFDARGRSGSDLKLHPEDAVEEELVL